MGYLNGYLARGGRNLNASFPKSQMPLGCPVEVGCRSFDQYIMMTMTLFHFMGQPRCTQLSDGTK